MARNRAFADELQSGQAHLPPLVLDLDDALLRTDLLHETAISFIQGNPLRVFLLLFWLMQGRAVLKRRLGERVQLDTEHLPVNDDLESFASAAHAGGRKVGIASAADQLLARRVARRFPFVSFVIASDGVANLKGAAKAEALKKRFPNGFSYAGDSRADLEVWRHAKSIVLVGASPRTVRDASKLGKPIEAIFSSPRLGVRGWLKAFRVHQWAKNTLLFVPLVLSGMASDPSAVVAALIAFVAMSLMASGTYLVNDLFDLADDRLHWSKRHRPLASGKMPLVDGVLSAGVLVTASFALIAVLGGAATGMLALYMVGTLLYSMRLKRVAIVDAFALASLFTLRLGLGIVVVGATPSAWLLVFSMFLFASLSFAKRMTEIQRSAAAGRKRINGRGYLVQDAGFVLAMGVATGMSAVTIMVLYLMNDAFSAGFYRHTEFLWALPVVLFLWVSRIWLLTHRQELHDDPVAFAIRDRVSIMLAALMGVAFLAGWLL